MLFFLILFAPQADRVTFRIITVRTEGEASELRARILAGESFEAVARERSTDSSAPAGARSLLRICNRNYGQHFQV